MTDDTVDDQVTVNDPILVETYMYHGWSSRRPVLPLLGGLLTAAAMAAAGWWIYRDLVEWEEAGNPERRIDAFTYMLYEVGGPLLPLGLMLATAVSILLASFGGFAHNRHLGRRRSGAPAPPMPVVPTAPSRARS